MDVSCLLQLGKWEKFMGKSLAQPRIVVEDRAPSE
jgi:hypothetical protein